MNPLKNFLKKRLNIDSYSLNLSTTSKLLNKAKIREIHTVMSKGGGPLYLPATSKIINKEVRYIIHNEPPPILRGKIKGIRFKDNIDLARGYIPRGTTILPGQTIPLDEHRRFVNDLAIQRRKGKEQFRKTEDFKILDIDTLSENSQIYLFPTKYEPKKTKMFTVPKAYPDRIFITSQLKDVNPKNSHNIDAMARMVGHEELHNALYSVAGNKASLGLDKISIGSVSIGDKPGKETLLYPIGANVYTPSERAKKLHIVKTTMHTKNLVPIYGTDIPIGKVPTTDNISKQYIFLDRGQKKTMMFVQPQNPRDIYIGRMLKTFNPEHPGNIAALSHIVGHEEMHQALQKNVGKDKGWNLGMEAWNKLDNIALPAVLDYDEGKVWRSGQDIVGSKERERFEERQNIHRNEYGERTTFEGLKGINETPGEDLIRDIDTPSKDDTSGDSQIYIQPTHKHQGKIYKFSRPESTTSAAYTIQGFPARIFLGNQMKNIDTTIPKNINAVASVLGHEELHNVLAKNVGEKASQQLDNIVPGSVIELHKTGKETHHYPKNLIEGPKTTRKMTEQIDQMPVHGLGERGTEIEKIFTDISPSRKLSESPLITLWHGTTKASAKKILSQGLTPPTTQNPVWPTDFGGESYLTSDPSMALSFAKSGPERARKGLYGIPSLPEDKSGPAVLKITVPKGLVNQPIENDFLKREYAVPVLIPPKHITEIPFTEAVRRSESTRYRNWDKYHLLPKAGIESLETDTTSKQHLLGKPYTNVWPGEDLIRDIGKDMDIIPEEQADNIPEAHKVKFEFHDIHKRRIYKKRRHNITHGYGVSETARERSIIFPHKKTMEEKQLLKQEIREQRKMPASPEIMQQAQTLAQIPIGELEKQVTQKGIPPPKTGIVKGAVTWVKGLFQDDKSKDMAYTGFESSRHR